MAIINGFEIIVNQFFQSLGLWLKWPMLAITAIGYEQFFVLLLPAVYWSVDQAVGLRMGMVLLLGTDLNTFFKFLFHNPRPFWISDKVMPLSHETSFGLPSGHAQTAASVWGLAFSGSEEALVHHLGYCADLTDRRLPALPGRTLPERTCS